MNNKQKSKYSKQLIKFLEENSNKGQTTITIPLQRKRKLFDSFVIHPIYKNFKIVAINTEKRVMPADTYFCIKIFEQVLEVLYTADKKTLKKGNAQKHKMGERGLENTTIEYIIASKFYDKHDGLSADRRISVISNILIAANLCISKKSSLTLI
jgi:hypothetical protein